MTGTNLKQERIKYVDISDTTPVNVNLQTSKLVTHSNFVCAIANDTQVICLPYYNANTQYVALKDLNLSAVSGTKSIRVFYRD